MAARELAWLAIPALASLLGVVAFNLWAFGHPLGIKNPIAVSGIETWTRSSALLFDRRSGILIQLPVILLGLAAMWAWRRRIPLVVMATVVIAVAVIYGNGTEPGSQTGGSFAGRYAWPLVPLLLGFSALYLIDLWRVRRAVVPLVVGARGGPLGDRVGTGRSQRAPLLQPGAVGSDLLPGLVGWPRPVTGTRATSRVPRSTTCRCGRRVGCRGSPPSCPAPSRGETPVTCGAWPASCCWRPPFCTGWWHWCGARPASGVACSQHWEAPDWSVWSSP